MKKVSLHVSVDLEPHASSECVRSVYCELVCLYSTQSLCLWGSDVQMKNRPQGLHIHHLDLSLQPTLTGKKGVDLQYIYEILCGKCDVLGQAGFMWVACVLVCGAPRVRFLLGTPETSRRGRSTRKARRALTSNPPGFPPWPCIDGWFSSPSPSGFSSLVKSSKTTLKSLSEDKEKTSHCCSEDNRKPEC